MTPSHSGISRLELGALLSVLALGIALRFTHIAAGLPEDVYVDAFKFVDEAARIQQTGDWRASDFQYPRFYTHSLAVLYRLLRVDTPYAAHLIANSLSAVAGSITILLGYLLARSWLGVRTSILVALLIAVCPVSVVQSRTAAPDALMTCFLLASLVVALEPQQRYREFLPGTLLGLAISCKFTALALAPVLALAVLLGWTGNSRFTTEPSLGGRLRMLGLGVAGTLLTLLTTTPQLLSHPAAYFERFLLEGRLQRAGQIGRIQGSPLDYLVSRTPTWELPWLSTSIVGNHGWLVLIAAGVGIWLVLRSEDMGDSRKSSFLILTFLGTMVVLFFGAGRIKAIRFLVPALPIVFLLSVVPVERLARRFARGRGVARSALFWLLSSMALCTVPTARTLSYLSAASHPTTQALAREWMSRNLPRPGAPIVTLLSPFFVDSLASSDLSIRTLPNVGSRQYRLAEGIGPSPEREPIYSRELVAAARATGIELVITNSYFDGAFSPVPENLRYFPVSVRNYAEYRTELHRIGTKIFEVSGIEENRLGPDIEIFRLAPIAAK